MKTKIVIPSPADVDPLSAVSIRTAGTAKYHHIRQGGGAECVGGLTLEVEPNRESSDVEFVEDIQRVHFAHADVSMNEINYWYIRGVWRSISTFCFDRAETNSPIVAVRFILTELLVHPVDSNERGYRIATMKALEDFFQSCELVQYSELVKP